jgi:hypothetical protein
VSTLIDGSPLLDQAMFFLSRPFNEGQIISTAYHGTMQIIIPTESRQFHMGKSTHLWFGKLHELGNLVNNGHSIRKKCILRDPSVQQLHTRVGRFITILDARSIRLQWAILVWGGGQCPYPQEQAAQEVVLKCKRKEIYF